MHYPTLLACPSGKRKTHHVGYFFCGHEQRLTRPESSLGMVQEGFKKRTTPGVLFGLSYPVFKKKGLLCTDYCWLSSGLERLRLKSKAHFPPKPQLARCLRQPARCPKRQDLVEIFGKAPLRKASPLSESDGIELSEHCRLFQGGLRMQKPRASHTQLSGERKAGFGKSKFAGGKTVG